MDKDKDFYEIENVSTDEIENKKRKKKENFIVITAFLLAAVVFLGTKYTLGVLEERNNYSIKKQTTVDNNKNKKVDNNVNNNSSQKDTSIINKSNIDLVDNSNHIRSASTYAYDTAEIRDYIMSNKEYTGNKKVFLTFDDGVTPGITDKILDILKEKEVHATFFIVGKTLSDNSKPYLERELKEGHSIAIHSFTHDYEKLYPNRIPSTETIKTEAEKTQNRLRELLGDNFKSHVWRYPGGHMSWQGLENENNGDDVLKNLGMEWIDWNSMNGDAEPLNKRPTNETEMLEMVKNSLLYWKQQDVVVILMHDSPGKELTIKSLPAIIDHFKSQGFEFGILK